MPAGRPRAFDYDQALEQAINVFWRKGYEGTSMPDLTEAMGMNRPSIYASFGNKEELFRKAIERYSEVAVAFFTEALDRPTVRESVENFLMASAGSYACQEKPRGCLAVQGALACSEEAQAVKEEALRRREMVVDVLDERFKRGVREKELSADTNTRELARFYTTVLQGMSIQSTGDVCCDDLKAIARNALKALPC
ncbi:MAG: TetR/AcrR family transcriptional regulator [Micavibrio sp.]